MHKRLVWLVLGMVSLLAGCVQQHNDGSGVIYTSEEGKFEVTVPTDWIPVSMDSLLTGVKFVGDDAAVTCWILYGNASGRAPSEQLDDLQAIVAFILEEGTAIQHWSQSNPVDILVDAERGSKCSFSYVLDEIQLKGLAGAVTHAGMDYLFIGQCPQAIWSDMEAVFDEVLESLRFID